MTINLNIKPRIPLSKEQMMDRLERILRKQEPRRREALLDVLNRETVGDVMFALNGGKDGHQDA